MDSMNRMKCASAAILLALGGVVVADASGCQRRHPNKSLRRLDLMLVVRSLAVAEQSL